MRLSKGIYDVLSIILGFLTAFLVGFGFEDFRQGQLPQMRTLIRALSWERNPSAIVPTDVFLQALNQIDRNYYGEVDRRELTYSAIQGMMSALNDPYTELWEPEMAERFMERNRGQFMGSAGIGAALSSQRGMPTVVRVFRNSPAEEAGILPGDVILEVDGISTEEENLEKVVDRIRGPEGTQVKLLIRREGMDKPLVKVLVRKMVEIQDVYGKLVPEPYASKDVPIGVLEIQAFSETVPAQFDKEISALEAKGIKGLIIDLRGNPGGIMGSAVEVSGRFVGGKLIATLRGRSGKPVPYYASARDLHSFAYPVVILVDESTASAAEIFAGALQDYKVATVVGLRTFGKGAVQKVERMPDGAIIKFTVAHYYLPDGESIERVENERGEQIGGGVVPNVLLNKKDVLPKLGDPDPLLGKGVAVILEKVRRDIGTK
ncbi:MAG: S41 family peptidase [Candidatus Caldarchaeum sp.]